MNMKDFFNEYHRIDRIIERRYDQYRSAKGETGSISSWSYDGYGGYEDTDELKIRWSDSWAYGGYDWGYDNFKIAWLELTDKEWDEFLEKTRKEVIKAAEKKKKNVERARQNAKRKKYEELKSEFEKEENNA